jgi:hypothetical protein
VLCIAIHRSALVIVKLYLAFETGCFSSFRSAASDYLRSIGDVHGTVEIQISIGKWFL